VAGFFVTLATGKEPENQAELVKNLQEWNNKQMAAMPTNKEQVVLLDIAYKIVKSLTGELIPLSKIVNLLMHETSNFYRTDGFQ
jgi:hypothetical protein